VVNAAGFDSFIYEDFADEAFNLLRGVANAMHTGNASEVLHDAFNDDMVQNYLITYLKVRHERCRDSAITDSLLDVDGGLDEDTSC